MLVVYNEHLNRIGLWIEGTEVVLVAELIPANGVGRRHQALVSDLHTYTSTWAVVGTL
jgi:hypothetical protein